MSRARKKRKADMQAATELERTIAALPPSPPKTLRQLTRDLKNEVAALPLACEADPFRLTTVGAWADLLNELHHPTQQRA